MAALEDADALHETACDVYDIATRTLDEARAALTEAARRLTEAEVEWNTAGAQMDALARHIAGYAEGRGRPNDRERLPDGVMTAELAARRTAAAAVLTDFKAAVDAFVRGDAGTGQPA